MSGLTVVSGASAIMTHTNVPPIANGWIAVNDGIVAAVGTGSPPAADVEIDAAGGLVLPGMVCAHHHLSQGTSRGVRTGPGTMGWLETHYRRWTRLRAEDVDAAARSSIAQLLLSGCTSVATFEYLHPAGENFVDPVVAAAAELGIRLLYVRGTAPVLEGGLADGLAAAGVDIDRIVEPPERGLAGIAHVIGRPKGPKLRWGCGPTTPVDDGGEFQAALNAIAEEYDAPIHLHFHPLGGIRDGETAFDLARRLGLVREGNWFAHGSRLSTDDVARLAAAGVGVVYCPSTSLRLGYVTPPLLDWANASDRVALAVDGAASNDRGSMLAETQLAWYLQGQPHISSSERISPEQCLHLATVGGARTIGWEGLGSLEDGAPADMSIFDLGGLNGSGSAAGPRDALFRLFTTHQGAPARHVLVAGQPIVREGLLLTGDVTEIARRAAASATHLAGFPFATTGS